MTIITKPITEKKADKLDVPLVENDQLAGTQPVEDVEAAPTDAHIILLRARARRVSQTTTLCLLFTALAVVGIGIVGGICLYRQYFRAQIFRGWCSIPYDNNSPDSPKSALLFSGSQLGLNSEEEEKFFEEMSNNVMQEKFEIDINREEYEKIEVPDFRDGRSGRFIHDFNSNKTGIIDVIGGRCFVMPLNRDKVLPPRSMGDLIQRLWEGYYNVNTAIVRENMRVVTPPVTDVAEIGQFLSRECEGYPIYKLEKFLGGVVKRSADLHTEAKFAEFAGKGITEFDIVNFEEVESYERLHLKQH